MMKVIKIAVILLLFVTPSTTVEAVCGGRFFNPVTDICWKCIFPIKIGSTTIVSMEQEGSPSGITNPICICDDQRIFNIPRVGLRITFFEPVRIIEVVKEPGCSPTLGGIEVFPNSWKGHGTIGVGNDLTQDTFYQVHDFAYPVLALLDIMTEMCFILGGVDLFYVTELDESWINSEIASFLNPEAALFGNPVAKAACMADALAANITFGLEPMFWCAGSWGSVYPFVGHDATSISPVQSTSLLAVRFIAKMHRQGMRWGSLGIDNLCSEYPIPFLKKSLYKLQMAYPVPQTIGRRCCQPIGRSTFIWGMNRRFPVEGEDFSYVLFQKRECCAY